MPEDRLRLKPFVIRFYLGAVVAFVFVKHFLRSWVLGRDLWVGLDVFVLSFPNAVEAVVGISAAYGLLLLARHRRLKWVVDQSDGVLLLVSALFTSAYVLSQEYGLHNLGGNNVTDPFDVVASIVGIIGTSVLYFRKGFFQRANQSSESDVVS